MAKKECRDCGKEFEFTPGRYPRKYCKKCSKARRKAYKKIYLIKAKDCEE